MTARPRTFHVTKAELTRLYVKARLPIRDIAAAFGSGKDTIARELKRHGIERRPAGYTKRGRLSDIPLELLEANVKALGIRGAARTLGIPFSTLRDHIIRKRQEGRKRT